MKLKALLIGWWVLMVCPVFGQLDNPYFHHLTVENGLSNGTNHFIYKDKTGFVWLSSSIGLNRFDGREVKVYLPNKEDPNSISGDNIQSTFFEDIEGNLWFTTYDGGINKYSRSSDSFEHFILKDPSGYHIAGYYCFYLENNQILWLIVNGDELYHFDILTKKFTFKLELPDRVLRISPQTGVDGKLRNLWAYSFGQTPGLLTKITVNDSLELERIIVEQEGRPLSVYQVLPENDNLIWIATDNGLLSYKLSQEKFERFFQLENKRIKSFRAIQHLEKDKLLVSSIEMGILVFDIPSKKFIKNIQPDRSNPSSLTTNDIEQIYKDRDGGLWFSTSQMGLDFYYPKKHRFHSFELETEVNEIGMRVESNSMVEDQEGNIWCGLEKSGIHIYDVDKKLIRKFIENPNDPSSIPNNNISFLYKTKDNRIWILNKQGLAVWLPKTNSIHRLRDFDQTYLVMCQLKNGKILISRYGDDYHKGGLFELKEAEQLDFRLEKIKSPAADSTFVSLWEDDQGRLFGCNSLTSILVMDTKDNFKLIRYFPIKGDSKAFYQKPDNGSIWIANTSGLIRINKELEEDSLQYFNEKNGLPSQVVYGILPDSYGKLWVSTNRGLASFDLDDFQPNIFSQADGLASLDFSSASFLAHSKGEFWFGSSGYITNFDPQTVAPFEAPAHPTITYILVNDQPFDDLRCAQTGATHVPEIKKLNLGYQQNTLSFNFAALEYSDPSKTKFRYQMVGVDKDWVENGTSNFARYANIPTGNFEFKLMATNSDGVWSEAKSLSIYIEPPYWETWWFYLLIGAAAASLLWYIVYTRRKRREELMLLEVEKRVALEQERQRIARDVHDDLGSGLSALSLLTAMAQYKSSPDDLKSEIAKINLSARDLSGKIREVIWTVSARNDTLANLISYLNQYALDLIENTEMDISVNLPEDIPEISVTGENRRTTFLAFKEALNNMHKHAEATAVQIDFKVVEDDLFISVSDNGKGFDPELLLQSTGNGLLNMRTRMKEIGGDCQFKTSDKGTKITFVLKLKKD